MEVTDPFGLGSFSLQLFFVNTTFALHHFLLQNRVYFLKGLVFLQGGPKNVNGDKFRDICKENRETAF